MKKLLKYGLWTMSAVIILLVIAFAYFAEISPSLDHSECYSDGGKWRVFPDSCGDLCHPSGCKEAFTPGCDCGPDKCWNGETCVTIVKGNEEKSLLPNCDYGTSYMSKDECICKDKWIMHGRTHSLCTYNDTTTFFCRKIENHIIMEELYVNFESGTTIEEAEVIVNKYGGKIVQYTCWFERRDNPYVIAAVKEGMKEDYKNQIQKEPLVIFTYEHRLSTTQ